MTTFIAKELARRILAGYLRGGTATRRGFTRPNPRRPDAPPNHPPRGAGTCRRGVFVLREAPTPAQNFRNAVRNHQPHCERAGARVPKPRADQGGHLHSAFGSSMVTVTHE